MMLLLEMQMLRARGKGECSPITHLPIIPFFIERCKGKIPFSDVWIGGFIAVCEPFSNLKREGINQVEWNLELQMFLFKQTLWVRHIFFLFYFIFFYKSDLDLLTIFNISVVLVQTSKWIYVLFQALYDVRRLIDRVLN